MRIVEDHSNDNDKIHEVIRLRGSLRIALRDLDGKVIEERIINNLLVTQGRSWVLGQLETVNQLTAQAIGFLAIGTSTVAPTTADTLLGSEVTRIAVGTWVTSTLTANPPSWQAQASFASNIGNTTLAECGLFNSSGANVATMLGHATFTSFSKTTSNTLTISYTISG
jgi:hypothetical protein